MEKEVKPNYSTLKEEPVIPPPPPSTFPTPVHPFPKFLPKKIALIIVILFFVIMLSGLIFTVYNFGKNSAGNQNPPAIISQTHSPTPDPTADWETFSSYLGFSIKYPNDNTLKEYNTETESLTGYKGKGIVISDEADNYFISIAIANNPNNLSSKEIIDNIIAENTRESLAHEKEYTEKNIPDHYKFIASQIKETSKNYKAGDISGTIFTYGSDHFQEYIIMTNKNKIFEFVFSDLDGQIVSENARKEIDQMLSTFKFTDSNLSYDISGWKEYSNKIFNFSFKYPQSYILDDKLPKNNINPIPPVQNIILTNAIGRKINIWVNPGGFGPFFSNKAWDLAYSTDKGIYLVNEEAYKETKNHSKEIISIISNQTENFDNHNLFFEYSFSKEDSSAEEEYKNILSTFRFE